jgi:two-component system response regulator PilR (NtrC family)
MADSTALIVDDEEDIRELVSLSLAPLGITVTGAGSVTEARRELQRRAFDVCITDMRLPDGSGLEFIEHVQQVRPQMPVAMITAHGSIDTAVRALKAGAFDFVTKPVDLGSLRQLVAHALELGESGEAPPHPDQPQLIGTSPAIERVRRMIAKVGRSQAPIYISGESGTGKELAARLIHDSGPRARKAFVPVNCGAIPEQLMESEFFGYRKGSFTGADRDKQGLFQAADGGTLFLDEVADLPPAMQVKLMRAIQERAVRRIGDQRETPVDVRILCATHRNLAELARQGEFRQDLFYRLNVIEVHMPALRERPGDIAELAGHIMQRMSARIGVATPNLSEAALEALGAYPFPGNVRELENTLERALTLCDKAVIDSEDLHLAAPAEDNREAPEAELPEDSVDLESYLENIERDVIMKTLDATRYNKTAAARKLGITFRALRYRLKKMGID